MKTSIFDMNFVLPPLVEITEVEKDMELSLCTRPRHWVFLSLCQVYDWGEEGYANGHPEYDRLYGGYSNVLGDQTENIHL